MYYMRYTCLYGSDVPIIDLENVTDSHHYYMDKLTKM